MRIRDLTMVLTLGCALASVAPWALTAVTAAAQESPQGAKAQGPVPVGIPAEAKSRKNPRPATPESLATGKLLYSSQCTMCHGAAGDGRGDLVERLGLTMPDFTDAARQRRRTDGELFYILTEGHGRMQGEGQRLSESVRWDIVNYVRTFAAAD